MSCNNIDSVTGRKKTIQRIINLIPKGLRLKINPDRFCIESFMQYAATKINGKMLDAGAGPSPYKKFFDADYEATDFDNKFDNLDFVCSLDKIPKPKNHYNAIISTEVLEHVEDPLKVLKEFNRVLKSRGKLFLTVPQGMMVHQEPYNYFYFTGYGLRSLLERAKFKNIKIKPKGGYFWYLANVLRMNELANQYEGLIKLLFYLFVYLFTNLIFPFILFHLDWIDKKKKWTIGYVVEAEK